MGIYIALQRVYISFMGKSAAYTRTRKKVPADTPCAYCFSDWASGWDHFIPVSYRVINSAWNLIPSCKRCNCIAGNRMFNSVEEKRAYINERLGRKGSKIFAVSTLQDAICRDASAPEILLPALPMGKLEPEAPESFQCDGCGKKRTGKLKFRHCSTKCRWIIWDREHPLGNNVELFYRVRL
jgi:hypothetical protein